jgi:serpin B
MEIRAIIRFSNKSSKSKYSPIDEAVKAFAPVPGSAAAAVVLMQLGAALQPSPIESKADRPFLFAISDNPTGAILFLGRVMNPTK